ncbi:MAG: hypothetical protein WBW33_12645 [Bryobacteraceae bacterium]
MPFGIAIAVNNNVAAVMQGNILDFVAPALWLLCDAGEARRMSAMRLIFLVLYRVSHLRSKHALQAVSRQPNSS